MPLNRRTDASLDYVVRSLTLTLARLRDARARGCTSAILAPSPDGRKLYASLGFRTQPQPPGYWYYLPHRSSS